MSDPTLDLAIDLISRNSVTPEDAGCQDLMITRLETLGFEIHRLRFDDVDNFWAQRGTARPLIAFAGHTDVVPSGPLENWEHDPFKAEIIGDMLCGRGAADMKTSLAAFITSIEAFLADHPNHPGSIGVLITSDEEGPSINGTVKVVEWLEQRGTKIDYCVVGEPSSNESLGDVIKNGRRGSINGFLTVRGKQGHVAYPHLAKNPVHLALAALDELAQTEWDQGSEYFPPTTFQIANIKAGTGAENVIPGTLDAQFNFRFSTALTDSVIRERVETVLAAHGLDFELRWRLSGQPFLTPEGVLVDAARKAIRDVTGTETALSTSGGTSDGRFIAPTGAEVVELGPLNATIHQVNERIKAKDAADLSRIYQKILEFVLD
ncbi:MAG: succinyl-diaminopimelate desuccinylase [Gammaproteobacteria bacterium]|nr:succinyl-diaminopimelate desuccinylase [Gammaproteobacteria bacterium]